MTFRERLERIGNKIEDCICAVLVDQDGIVVEEYKVDPVFDAHLLVAEYSAFLKAADKASVSSEVGRSREIVVFTEKASLMIKKITEDYFLVLVTQSEKNIGKGRFLMKREAALFTEEL